MYPRPPLTTKTTTMNKATRKELSTLLSQLEDIKSRIEEIRDEEQEKFGNLNEGFQASPMGQNLEGSADKLSDVCNDMDTAIDSLTSATEE